MKIPARPLCAGALALLLLFNGACFSSNTGQIVVNRETENGLRAAGIGLAVAATVGLGMLLFSPSPCREPGPGDVLDAEQWTALADCRAKKGLDAEAEAARVQAEKARAQGPCGAAVPKQPDDARAWRLYADCLQLNGRIQAAQEARQRAEGLPEAGAAQIPLPPPVSQ